MVLIRVRPFLFARAMMSFHKILRITERPHRADKSAIIGINLRTSPSTSVGARPMGSGGEGLHPPSPLRSLHLHFVRLMPMRADKSAMCAINRHLLDDVVYLHASSSMPRAKEDISPVPVRSGDRSCALPPPLSSGRAGAAECP